MSHPYGATATEERLLFRANWIRRLREWFWARDFVEVETPVLSWDSVIDRHLDPIVVPCEATGLVSPANQRHEQDQKDAKSQAGKAVDTTRSPDELFLQTSPEFGMKRLLATGLPRIFQVTRAFRAGERGPWHNPEFTIAEWYSVDDNYERGIERLADLAAHMFPSKVERGVRCLSYREAFQQAAGLDPFADDKDAMTRRAIDLLSDESLAPGELAADPQWMLDLVFDARVQPMLRGEGAVIVTDYPADQSALARTAEREYGRVAERFELFIDGIELANGYHELLDPDELEQRNRTNNQLREADGKRPLPPESRLIEAMRAGLPACAGVALGVDRAVAVACGADTIDQVWAFPWERA
ncbi:MAG: EF-P lysine aminoacylase GenX [Planctomycetales bacterium]|nr:EF-P lysine aminoacylase GenX [Planctomycetales bacterium]